MSGVQSSELLFESDRPPMDQSGPLLTIALSLYNYAEEISTCLESVKSQTHARLDLIVVDDASTDGSEAVAQSWLRGNAQRFERIRLFRQTYNQGLSTARNLAFEQASSDYVFVLDADNTLYPHAIARLYETIEDTHAAVAYSQLVMFGEISWLGVANVWRAEGFLNDNYIDAMALVSKAAWAQVGGYTQIDYGWEDYDLWCKFIEAGLKGVFVPELLCRYRVHAKSMRHTDTTIERARLVHFMLAAHPWLRLTASQ